MPVGIKAEHAEADAMEEDEAPANLDGPGGPQSTSQGKRKRGKPIKDEDDEVATLCPSLPESCPL